MYELRLEKVLDDLYADDEALVYTIEAMSVLPSLSRILLNTYLVRDVI